MSDANWTALTIDDLMHRGLAPKISAARTKALDAGQTDPAPEILAAVTDEVRGYVAAGGYQLAEGALIPKRLLAAAVDMALVRLLDRMDAATKDQRDRERAAVRLLERVAERRGVDIPAPQSADADEPSGNQAHSQVVKPAKSHTYTSTSLGNL